MQEIGVIFQIFVLVFSVIIHEISHGFMARAWGDKTAEYEGRLTLNPIPHIDLFGTIILPLFLWITNAGFMIGWAKPVPYNPYNLRNRKVAEPLVALAGPLSNLLIAAVFGMLIRILVSAGNDGALIGLFAFVVLVNVSLALFNLIPIPPLDGSKILFSLLPLKSRFVFSEAASRYGMIAIILVVIFLPGILSPLIYRLFALLTGLA